MFLTKIQRQPLSRSGSTFRFLRNACAGRTGASPLPPQRLRPLEIIRTSIEAIRSGEDGL
jgi:hypothetical protein